MLIINTLEKISTEKKDYGVFADKAKLTDAKDFKEYRIIREITIRTFL